MQIEVICHILAVRLWPSAFNLSIFVVVVFVFHLQNMEDVYANFYFFRLG